MADKSSACRIKNPGAFSVGERCQASFARIGFPLHGCLGCGRQGCTFATVPPWVVKITDENEAVIAKEVGSMDTPHPAFYRVARLNGRPAVIRLGKCAGESKDPVYAIIREDIPPLTVADEGKFNFATSRLESVARDILVDGKAWDTRFPSQSDLTLESVHPADRGRLRQFLSLVQWSILRRVLVRDMVVDNLGIRPGTNQLVVRDAGVFSVFTPKKVCRPTFKSREKPGRVVVLAGFVSR